mmetsp:Transcript_5478/g.15403  ORF Transcript_5478/g.15403 Transcript_5478/m.15403 type:complete len:220 (+) Transcript_5478:961-1620(+)
MRTVVFVSRRPAAVLSMIRPRPSTRSFHYHAAASSHRAGPRRRCRRRRAARRARRSRRRARRRADAPASRRGPRRAATSPRRWPTVPVAVRYPLRTRPHYSFLCLRRAAANRRCRRRAPPRAPCARARGPSGPSGAAPARASLVKAAAVSQAPPSSCSAPSSTRSTPSCRGRRRPARPLAATYRSSRGRWARRARPVSGAGSPARSRRRTASCVVLWGS